MNILLDNLNEEQKQSVLETEGYVRIIAGAGSGKTRVLSKRYAHIVLNLGVSTRNILCVTFTNKAAQEMKKRIRRLIGNYDNGYISTFHGFCVTVLREDIHNVSYPKDFVIIDREDQKSILKKVYEDCNLTLKDMTFAEAISYISKNKCIEELINLDQESLLKKYTIHKEDPKKTPEIIRAKILYGYLYEQRKIFGLDFNDLIHFTLYILRNNSSILKKWQERLQYVMVDEFQDVSQSQYDLAILLSGYHKNLFVVGDPDQIIYSWRGNDPKFIINCFENLEDVKTFTLNQNYRSTAKILNVANYLIQKNTERIKKDLVPIKKIKNTSAVYNHLKTQEMEATWIAKEIKDLASKNISLNDIAILYRAHYVSRSLEEALLRENIPYTIYSGQSFYERKEIKDILAYLRFCLSKDDIAFLRIINEPKRNIGKKRIQFLKDYADEHNCSLYSALEKNIYHELFISTKANDFIQLIQNMESIINSAKVSDLLEFILNLSGYEEQLRLDGDQDRIDNLAELKHSIAEYERNYGEDLKLSEYLQQVTLLTNSDKDTSKKTTVKLMTIHSAKGLEFPCIFVCGMSEGIFPSSKVKTRKELEEERRLAYVAITRAESKLYLSDAEGYSADNSFRYPSRFILEIEPKLLTFITELDELYKKDALNYINRHSVPFLKNNNLNSYKVGGKIQHTFFGIGEIIKYNDKDDTYTVQFEKANTPRTIKLNTSNTKPLSN